MSGVQAPQGGALAKLRAFAAQRSTSLRALGIAVVVLGVIGFLLQHTAQQPPAPKPPPVTMVTIQPQKPPPPPPPLPQPKMITPPKMTTPEAKPLQAVTPTHAPPKPAAPATTQMGTSIHGNGPPDAFNLSGTPGGDGFGGGGGGGGTCTNGAMCSYFATVQTEIQEALQKNRITRNASAGLEVHIWLDADGNVTRVSLDKSSGDPSVDDAVKNQVLRNARLQPPPSGQPMEMVMRLTGEQPLQ